MLIAGSTRGADAFALGRPRQRTEGSSRCNVGRNAGSSQQRTSLANRIVDVAEALAQAAKSRGRAQPARRTVGYGASRQQQQQQGGAPVEASLVDSAEELLGQALHEGLAPEATAIAQLAWAAAKLGSRRRVLLFKRLAQLSRRMQERFHMRDLAKLGWAFAVLDMKLCTSLGGTPRRICQLVTAVWPRSQSRVRGGHAQRNEQAKPRSGYEDYDYVGNYLMLHGTNSKRLRDASSLGPMAGFLTGIWARLALLQFTARVTGSWSTCASTAERPPHELWCMSCVYMQKLLTRTAYRCYGSLCSSSTTTHSEQYERGMPCFSTVTGTRDIPLAQDFAYVGLGCVRFFVHWQGVRRLPMRCH
eukprot:TRINITY_DN14270_c0_g1_i1.p1 TRINITY_DN14270_c0_g1~~TRINITY_DN14270_c0_g1_i1.p1  ORF type:complete len:360 (+),score=14.72 TRINITY_DN14270_c0_g1_i1:129-1208(+)